MSRGPARRTGPVTIRRTTYDQALGLRPPPLPYSTCCHRFRATGITTYLQNGGNALEHAQTIANRESLRTTKLYDRTREELTFEEVERIKI
jgi:hypothetical protein